MRIIATFDEITEKKEGNNVPVMEDKEEKKKQKKRKKKADDLGIVEVAMMNETEVERAYKGSGKGGCNG